MALTLVVSWELKLSIILKQLAYRVLSDIDILGQLRLILRANLQQCLLSLNLELLLVARFEIRIPSTGSFLRLVMILIALWHETRDRIGRFFR